MLLYMVWYLPLHAASSVQAHDHEQLAARVRRLNGGYWQEESRRIAQKEPTTGRYASGEVLDEDPYGTLGSRLLYAFWRLCEQQISIIEATEPGHSARVIVPEPSQPTFSASSPSARQRHSVRSPRCVMPA
jgi:hypothetical protein